MQRQAAIQAVVIQASLALALLLGTATPALAQAAPRQDAGAVAQSAAAIDPNGSSVDDVLEELRGDTTAGGSATSDDPAQLAGTDAAEVDADSTRSGPQVDENGERGVPFVGDRLLFLPAVKTDGTASTRMTSESAAAAAAGTPSGQSLLGDFNGDGYDDLVVGVPYEDVVTGGIDNFDAGAVTVILWFGVRTDRRRQPGLDAGHGGHAGRCRTRRYLWLCPGGGRLQRRRPRRPGHRRTT